VAFEVLGVVAVITNCSLVAISSSVKKYTQGYSDFQVMLFFVAAEVRSAYMSPIHEFEITVLNTLWLIN